jgi:hypothetical protein
MIPRKQHWVDCGKDCYYCCGCTLSDPYGDFYIHPRDGKPYYPKLLDCVLFSFKDFRSMKEILRQKKSAIFIVSHHIKDILMEEKQDKKSYWSWIPKDLICVVAEYVCLE